MRPEEAIKILQNDPPRPHPLNNDEFERAYDLGIEALKFLIELRGGHDMSPGLLLPGETEE